MAYEALRKLIKNSKYLVCLQGLLTSETCGCMNYRSGSAPSLMEIESKYGHSPDEILNSTFFNTRPGEFYHFYRNEMLSKQGAPDSSIDVLRRLEEDGILKAIITRELYSLAKRGNCKNVIELHGNIFSYHCPHCHRPFHIDYIMATDKVPLCPDCNTVIRPGIALTGETVSNKTITQGADYVSKADTLLIIGCNMRSILVSSTLQYFKGEHVILINDVHHYADRLANHVYHAMPEDVLTQLYPL